ncbi:MAG: twin-arginine translocase TatA/TatE family subunit [Acidobacteriota bacterium]
MGLGVPELVLIFMIIVLMFGASRLPQLGKSLGEGLSNFKSGLKGDESDKLPASEEASGSNAKG